MPILSMILYKARLNSEDLQLFADYAEGAEHFVGYVVRSTLPCKQPSCATTLLCASCTLEQDDYHAVTGVLCLMICLTGTRKHNAEH